MLEMGEFKFDLSNLTEACKIHKPGRIAVQVPAALQNHSAEISNYISDAVGVEVFMVSRPSYGACDIIDTNTIKAMGIDMVVNIGHSELPDVKETTEKLIEVPLVFLEMQSRAAGLNISKKDVEKLGRSVALAATVQYVHIIPEVAKILNENNIETRIGTGDGRIKYKGQVLGCNYSSILSLPGSEIDSYLFVGTGRFHPLGIALAIDKPLFVLDPNIGIIYNFENRKDRFLRQRHGLITIAGQRETFAVVVSTKPGQYRLDTAVRLKEMLRSHGKKPVLFITGELNPSDYNYADIDVIVSTACPRIALDDHAMYEKPIITPVELEIALDERSWEAYIPDTING